MKTIDEAKLEQDLGYRFEYLTEFASFFGDDIAAIHAAAEFLAPQIPGVVDAVYDKLFGYDATKRHFVPKQHGYDGPIPENLADLTLDHPMIAFRKQHLSRYLEKLFTAPYDEKMVRYLDHVGKIHTDREGSKSIRVPGVQMNALMTLVADVLLTLIFDADLSPDRKKSTLRAVNKLLWLQNDLIQRHYYPA